MTRARRLGWRGPSGALALLGTLAAVSCGTHEDAPTVERAVLFLIPGVSFEEAMAVPEVVSLARAGGAGLLVDPASVPTAADVGWAAGAVEVVRFEGALGSLGGALRQAVASGQPGAVLVVVASDAAPRSGPSNDELTPVVVASGRQSRLFPDEGAMHSVTSGSTRRDGVVAGIDVDATLRTLLEGPRSDLGEPIRTIAAEPPFELRERYLAQRRMYVPVGTGAALYLTAVGLAGIGVVAIRRAIPDRGRRAVGWAALSVAMLPVGMLATGHLPELSYATAVPLVAIVTVLGTMAFSPLERAEPTLVPAGIGVAVLAFFVVEALTGWAGMMTPLLGGSQLDGGRFYGFPNVAIGLAVGAALWVAHRMRTWMGFALLCGLGLFVGLPYLGTNLGGAVTAFAAAGLWVAIRERERLGARTGIGVVAVVTVLGAAVILAAHALAPFETHVSNFERTVTGLGGVVERYVDRLGVGFDLIARNPAALVPVIGLPVLLFVVLSPPGPIRAGFERWPAWRDAVLVTVLAGIVAYVVNDSGPAAAGLAFGLALGGTLGVSLLAAPEKMAGR